MSGKDDIGRRKLMDWIRPDEAYGGIAAMLATTFELGPTFFDSDYLPTFLGLGAWEDTSWSNRVAMQRALSRTEATVVMMDARRFRGRPRSLHIELIPKVVRGGMKLHAKVLVVVQEKAVRLLVGSANLTEPGYRRNREVALPIIATEQTPEASALIDQALNAMPDALKSWWTSAASSVCDRARETMANWRRSASTADQFVWSWGAQSLSTKFAGSWPNEKILRVTIVSPFWSDQGASGPVARLLEVLGLERLSGAKVRLLTEAADETQTTFRPKIPAALASWDVRSLGIEGEIQAVDPHVLAEEVGGRTDFQLVRPLHAKIVVIEGPQSTLAYVGSANLTMHGWGFAGSASNIEAGVIMLRHGRARAGLGGLIPKTIGRAVPLDGKGRSAVTVVEKTEDDLLWPEFIHDIRLTPAGGGVKELQLVVTIETAVPFSVSLVGDPKAVLVELDSLASGPLQPSVLEQLLRDQRVQVSWQGQSVEFPLNVDSEARLLLPVSPGATPPGEHLLLAYYQGKISANDIYPAPPGESENAFDGFSAPDTNDSTVDTSRIQSYQVREFVEALQGIVDDLKLAATGTEIGMKYALLGEISPVALARAVIRAVQEQQRSSTAAGFQLVEILACLEKAQNFVAQPHRLPAWQSCLAAARREVTTCLSDLMETNSELKTQRIFLRYRAAILQQVVET